MFKNELGKCETEDQMVKYLKDTDPYLAGVFLLANKKESQAKDLQKEFSNIDSSEGKDYTKYILGNWLIELEIQRRKGLL